MFGFDRITHNPDILGGKACVRGMRISVSLVVNLVANGMPVQEILEEYPDLEAKDIQQALHYAAWAVEDTVYTPVGVPASSSWPIWDWPAARWPFYGLRAMMLSICCRSKGPSMQAQHARPAARRADSPPDRPAGALTRA